MKRSYGFFIILVFWMEECSWRGLRKFKSSVKKLKWIIFRRNKTKNLLLENKRAQDIFFIIIIPKNRLLQQSRQNFSILSTWFWNIHKSTFLLYCYQKNKKKKKKQSIAQFSKMPLQDSFFFDTNLCQVLFVKLYSRGKLEKESLERE